MIIKAALLVVRDSPMTKGEVELLFVRDVRKPYFVFPGGKQEPGENIIAALHRELGEELGVDVVHVKEFGVVQGKTPDSQDLQMHLFTAKVLGIPHPQAEIGQLAWMTRRTALEQQHLMTPMSLDHIFPFLHKHKIW